MKQIKNNLFLRNICFLLLFVAFCAILSRLLTAGETLSQYEQSYQKPIPREEIVSESITEESATSEPAPELPITQEDPMPNRITYQTGFYYESLSESLINRITGISFPADSKDLSITYDDLRYVCVLYYNFQGEECQGELICNQLIAQDLVEIFYELYRNQYEIEKICLIDDYQGNDDLSMKDNNTSCFNYRTVSGSQTLSMHGLGLAIDLNPFYNPYVTYPSPGEISVSPAESSYYADRSRPFAYKIDQEDLAYRLFTEHGFTWGGNWNSCKDYQHFEKKSLKP